MRNAKLKLLYYIKRRILTINKIINLFLKLFMIIDHNRCYQIDRLLLKHIVLPKNQYC